MPMLLSLPRSDIATSFELTSESRLPSKGAVTKTMRVRRKSGPVATSTKRLMSYIDVRDIESETSYPRGKWHLFALKELMDNGWDFENDYYTDSSRENRNIAVTVRIEWDKHLLRLTVRNSNVDNIPVFDDLDQIFNFDIWYSTKRYQHRETTGSLGDFLKRSLGMGYAAWTDGLDEDDSFIDEQWTKPTIVRHNGKETRVFITVHKGSSEPIKIEFEDGPPYNDTYTEVEVPLLLPKYFNNELADQLEQYYKCYRIGKAKTNFSFRRVDE